MVAYVRCHGWFKRTTFALDGGWLVNPTKTPIRRHIKVKSNANPFDPNWRGYFESRKNLKRASSQR
jgi:hypothetical protein